MGESNSTHHAIEATAYRAGRQERFQPSPGTIVDGRFELIKKIGEGGMGVVYLAKQLNIGRDVVIKLLKPHLCSNEDQVNRFHREASLASRLSHPNCVTIHDFGFYQETPYIVMEHLEGIPLVDILYQRGRLSFEETINILSQTCDALEAARQLEVVHRDLKPENIFVLSEPIGSVTVKVLDFGIAKLAHTHPEASDSNLTRGDMIFGTPQYMAPEQIRGKPIDHRADVYALTIIFYEMVAGHLPYDSTDTGDVVSILTQHLRDPIPLLGQTDVDSAVVPLLDQINAVISTGMAKSIKKRIVCADDLKKELHRLKEIAQIKAEPVIARDIDYHSSSNRLVTRPSLLFSTLGDLTHDAEGVSSINVVDLLPTTEDQSHEPQVSSHSPHHNHPTQVINQPGSHLTSPLTAPISSASPTNTQSTRSGAAASSSIPALSNGREPKVTGGTSLLSSARPSSQRASKRSPSERRAERGFLSRAVRLMVWMCVLSLIVVVSMTYPRSPLAKRAWVAHLPESVAQPIRQAEHWLAPKLQPIYVWVDHQLELPPLSSEPSGSTRLAPQDTHDPAKLTPREAEPSLTSRQNTPVRSTMSTGVEDIAQEGTDESEDKTTERDTKKALEDPPTKASNLPVH